MSRGQREGDEKQGTQLVAQLLTAWPGLFQSHFASLLFEVRSPASHESPILCTLG